MLIDTHVHLSDAQFKEDIDAVVRRARLSGVNAMINVGADLTSSQLAVKQAQQYNDVYAAVGIHPHDARHSDVVTMQKLVELASKHQVVAWGEIGLDYHYDLSPRLVQQEVFAEQLELAYKLRLPVIIHDREAHQDVWSILKEWQGKLLGVIHCYSGSLEMAKNYINMGFYIAIGGALTFKNARKLPEVVLGIPLNRLLLETDCPYLAPVPYRGKRNEPAYVNKVAEKVAEIKEISIDEVSRQTTSNAIKLFNLSGEYE